MCNGDCLAVIHHYLLCQLRPQVLVMAYLAPRTDQEISSVSL